MPTYSYQCENCHHQFDIFQHFSEDSLITCPKCGQPTLRKVYTPVGIVFKGSGFYATDHRSPSGQTHVPHEHGEHSEHNDHSEHGTGGTDSSSESKPEEKKSTPAKTETASSATSSAPGAGSATAEAAK